MSATDADRKKAVTLLRAASADDLIHSTAPMAQPLMVDRVAEALAAERGKAQAPFLRLMREYHDTAAQLRAEHQYDDQADFYEGVSADLELAAIMEGGE